jgi:hypothetical protein
MSHRRSSISTKLAGFAGRTRAKLWGRSFDTDKKRLIDGPVLRFRVMEKFDFSFDPNQVIPLDDNNTIYPTLCVTDVWDVLEAGDGALMKRDRGKFGGVAVEAAKDAVGKSGVVEGPGRNPLFHAAGG